MPAANAQAQVPPGWHAVGTAAGSAQLEALACDRVAADGGAAAGPVALALLYVVVDAPGGTDTAGYLLDASSTDPALAAALAADGFPGHVANLTVGPVRLDVDAPAYGYHGADTGAPVPESRVADTFSYYRGPVDNPSWMEAAAAVSIGTAQQPESGTATGLLADLVGPVGPAGLAATGTETYTLSFHPPHPAA